jgi:hypothetical protein
MYHIIYLFLARSSQNSEFAKNACVYFGTVYTLVVMLRRDLGSKVNLICLHAAWYKYVDEFFEHEFAHFVLKHTYLLPQNEAGIKQPIRDWCLLVQGLGTTLFGGRI